MSASLINTLSPNKCPLVSFTLLKLSISQMKKYPPAFLLNSFSIKLTAFFLLFSPVNESYPASYFNISSLFNCSVISVIILIMASRPSFVMIFFPISFTQIRRLFLPTTRYTISYSFFSCICSTILSSTLC